MTELNPYKINWLILTPTKGKVNKKDLKTLQKTKVSFFICNGEAMANFGSKEIARNKSQG